MCDVGSVFLWRQLRDFHFIQNLLWARVDWVVILVLINASRFKLKVYSVVGPAELVSSCPGESVKIYKTVKTDSFLNQPLPRTSHPIVVQSPISAITAPPTCQYQEGEGEQKESEL